MLEKSEGLVLKTIRFSESSVIVRIFTRERGWLNFHVPGIRSSRNKSKGNLFQPLQFLELDIYHHPNKQLLKIKEYRPALIYERLPFDMYRHATAVFCLEVLSKCLHEHEPNIELYDYSRHFFSELDHASTLNQLWPQIFLLQTSRILGFHPLIPDTTHEENLYFHLQDGRFEPFPDHLGPTLDHEATYLLLAFLRNQGLSFQLQERNIITESLLSYFRSHIPGFGRLSSLEILRQIIR
jgi:DNA repair protein RecO (recombination protein O)